MTHGDTGSLEYRRSVFRKLLYPVLFAPDVAAEAGRVAAYFRDHDPEFVPALIAVVRDELATPSLEVRNITELLANPSEPDVRAFVRRVAEILTDAEAS